MIERPTSPSGDIESADVVNMQQWQLAREGVSPAETVSRFLSHINNHPTQASRSGEKIVESLESIFASDDSHQQEWSRQVRAAMIDIYDFETSVIDGWIEIDKPLEMLFALGVYAKEHDDGALQKLRTVIYHLIDFRAGVLYRGEVDRGEDEQWQVLIRRLADVIT